MVGRHRPAGKEPHGQKGGPVNRVKQGPLLQTPIEPSGSPHANRTVPGTEMKAADQATASLSEEDRDRGDPETGGQQV